MGMSWKVWFLIILLVLAVITIVNPQGFGANVQIKEIKANSSAAEAGIMAGEIIKQIDNASIKSLEDYTKAIESIEVQEVDFTVKTENETFNYQSKVLGFDLSNNTILIVGGKAAEAGLKAGMRVEKINDLSLDEQNWTEIKAKLEPKAKITILTNKQEYIFLTSGDLGIVPVTVSKTRLRTGLDLQGGARALIKPERELTPSEMASLLETVRYRLNVYGLSDVNVREVGDLEGNQYMLVEMAGATPKDLQELVGKQGKFEAKIANETVFIGGKGDIPAVCRDDATCARIESCNTLSDGTETCKFYFTITLSNEAAGRQANTTAGLAENASQGQCYLNESIYLYLDDNLVDSLLIDCDLKGKPSTQIAISGSGVGKTREEAYNAAQANMKKLQTVLITGSLPFKLEIAKLDSISPALGKEFTRNMLFASIAAFIGVCLVIYLRYRKPILFLPVVVTMVSEVLLVLFIAAVIKWNLDLASIAGIIAAIGTGVDDQIVMIDESRDHTRAHSMKERIKRAFFIIMSAYATVVVSLLPLFWAGAGLLRGFAVTTLLGITVGVFITRPAFAEILKKVTKE
jgi:preprotein translocase subunit SecD